MAAVKPKKRKPKPKKHFKFPDTGTQYIDSLGRQLEKVYENSNLKGIETRHTYFDYCCRFVKAIAVEYRIKDIKNIQDKHLRWYAEKLLAEGQSPKTVKNALSAIRFTHKINPKSVHELAESTEFNKSLSIPSTPDGRVDRAWTPEEIDRGVKLARTLKRPEIANIIRFMDQTGCRLDEAATIRRTHLEEALRTGELRLVNTKGRRLRFVPLSEEALALCRELAKPVERGAYVFVPEGQKVHKYKKSVQDFINRHREKIQEKGRGKSAHEIVNGRAGISAHGVRHKYAREEYESLISGRSRKEAEREVAERLGHGRPEVTRIYTSTAHKLRKTK
jgi:integrase/recombinase XerD